MKPLFFYLVPYFVFQYTLSAQVGFPVNGAPNPKHEVYAFTNCQLHVDAEVTITNGILIIQDKKVIAAAQKADIPKGAIVTDVKGKHIYPAFIDLYSDYGMPEAKRTESTDAPKKGAYGANQAIKSEVEAHTLFLHNQQKADELRKQGFATILTHVKDGIVRGSGVLVCLDNNKENESIIKDRAAGFYSFNKGMSSQYYPSSLMGAVALLRQTYYDAQWYASSSVNQSQYNITLDAFNKLQQLPSVFDANDKYNDVRAQTVADEFKKTYIIKGGGNEYQRLYDIQNTFSKFIIPVNFPEAIDVEDPYDAEQASLAELKHWEMAPSNLAQLQKNNVQFCITSADLKDKSNFLKNLRKAIKYGLTENQALKALTQNPATFINVYDKVGSLKNGMLANFFISSKPIFDEDAIIYETWSNGTKHTYSDLNAIDISGTYNLIYDANSYKLQLTKEQEQYNGTVFLKDSLKAKVSASFKNNILTFSFPYDSTFSMRFTGNYNLQTKLVSGVGQYANGNWVDFKLNPILTTDTIKKVTLPNKSVSVDYGKVFYPFGAYGEPLPDSDGLLKDTWKN